MSLLHFKKKIIIWKAVRIVGDIMIRVVNIDDLKYYFKIEGEIKDMFFDKEKEKLYVKYKLMRKND